MSTQTTINDVPPKTQITATGSQFVFTTNWTANVASDVLVYLRGPNEEPDDYLQLVNSVLYSVNFVGAQQTVEVTFITAPDAGDIVTITRNTPADRLNLYTNTNFTASMLNQDIGILTLVDQQAQLYNDQIAPHYNVSATIDLGDQISGLGGDIYLPVLGANQFWFKNANNTEIRAADLPTGGGQLPVTLPLVTYTATPFLTNEANLGALPTGFLFGTVAGGVSTLSSVSYTGSGNVVREAGPTISDPDLIEPKVINTGLTVIDYTVLESDAVGTQTVTFPNATGTVQLVQSSPTMQVFTSGTGTYTTPAGVKYIKVEMVGGGGGGSSNGGAPSNGTNTTFGTALLTANANNSRAGGSFTINAPAYGFGVTGGTGGERTAWSGATFTLEGPGGIGGSSFFGGSDSAYGAGGEGAFVSAGGTAASGIGGGAGGYVCAYIDGPSATYSYTVGAGGAGAGTGANGVGGVIIVTEYYQ